MFAPAGTWTGPSCRSLCCGVSQDCPQLAALEWGASLAWVAVEFMVNVLCRRRMSCHCADHAGFIINEKELLACYPLQRPNWKITRGLHRRKRPRIACDSRHSCCHIPVQHHTPGRSQITRHPPWSQASKDYHCAACLTCELPDQKMPNANAWWNDCAAHASAAVLSLQLKTRCWKKRKFCFYKALMHFSHGRLARIPITPIAEKGSPEESILRRHLAALALSWRLGNHRAAPLPECVKPVATYPKFLQHSTFFIGWCPLTDLPVCCHSLPVLYSSPFHPAQWPDRTWSPRIHFKHSKRAVKAAVITTAPVSQSLEWYALPRQSPAHDGTDVLTRMCSSFPVNERHQHREVVRAQSFLWWGRTRGRPKNPKQLSLQGEGLACALVAWTGQMHNAVCSTMEGAVYVRHILTNSNSDRGQVLPHGPADRTACLHAVGQQSWSQPPTSKFGTSCARNRAKP